MPATAIAVAGIMLAGLLFSDDLHGRHRPDEAPEVLAVEPERDVPGARV